MKHDSLKIAACGLHEVRRRRKCLIGDARKLTPIAGGFTEPLSDLIGYRRAEIGVIEDRSRQATAEYRVVGQDCFRLTPD
jgi:hypothetical protein